MRALASLVVLALLLVAPAPATAQAAARDPVVDRLLTAVFLRAARDLGTVPDDTLLPAKGPILVRAEITAGLTVSAGVLPRGRRKFVVRALADLQTAADLANAEIAVLVIEDVAISGDQAAVTIGVALVRPANDGSASLCCCTAAEAWVRKKGRWKFVERTFQICS